MPNTLAHAGAQGLVTQSFIREADLKWVYLGCVIPDVPWILRRAVQIAVSGADPYLLRAYAIVQASLFSCLILCGAIALLSNAFWRVYLLLGGNSMLHLLIDAMQTKWGNGVHLWAPFSWTLTNWGLFWPEHWMSYLLTGLGLGYILWHWRGAVQQNVGLGPLSFGRLAGVLSLTIAYFLLPFLFLRGPVQADNHYLQTLQSPASRAGEYIECDRASLRSVGSETVLRCWDGKSLNVRKGEDIDPPATVSVRGVFVKENMLILTDLHVHREGARDLASYLGLMLIAGVWFGAWINIEDAWNGDG